MQQPNFPRKWTGYFRYGTAYSLSLQLSRVSFELELNLRDQQFEGTCTDEYILSHFETPAVVKGEYGRRTIEFVKKYPCSLMHDENDNLVVNHDQPATPIIYKGKIRKSWWRRRYYASGIWTITVLVPDYNGSPVTHTVDGRWKMWAPVSK